MKGKERNPVSIWQGEGKERRDGVKIGAIRDLGNYSSSSDSQVMKIFYSGLLKIRS